MNLEPYRAAIARWLRTPIDLSYFAGWRELLMLIGVAAIVRGVALWNMGLAWIVAGAFLLAGAVFMARDDRP